MNRTILDYTLPALSACEPEKVEAFTDDAILQAFSYGRSEWALEQLYVRYKQYMYGLAYRILRDSYLAEDVIQDVFLTLWHKAFSYQKELGSLKSWLQTIVRNRALDKIRSSMYREYQFTPLLPANGQDIASHEAEMWQQVWGGEQANLIRKALSELPVEQRQVIEMNYFAGYAHAEIARRLQVPIGTVKGRIRLGLAKIKPLLQAYGVEVGV